MTQIEKLKKEKQILDHRSAALNGLPAAQRKDVEELKETLAKQQEEHRGKELRLRLTVISLPLFLVEVTYISQAVHGAKVKRTIGALTNHH